MLGGDQAVVGGDTRRSTPMLAAAFSAGMAAEGVTVHQLGVVPTPTVAFLAAERRCAGAVVSASHNPFHDNGIKLFAPGGTKLPDELEARIEAEVAALAPPSGEPGELVAGTGVAGYVDHLVASLQGRSLAGLRVVVDAANGAASPLAGEVFSAAGADVVVIHDQPDGRNINAGCGATAPGSLAAAVVEHRADLGVALDGDADRLIAVDHTGAIVDGDHIIALCALDLRARGELVDDTVVVTVMTNLGFRLAMERAGIHVVETAVGDRYVLEALDERGLGARWRTERPRDLPPAGDDRRRDADRTGAVRPRASRRSTAGRARRRRDDAAAAGADQRGRAGTDARCQRAVRRRDRGRGRALGQHRSGAAPASGTEPLVRVMVEAESDADAHRAAEDLAAIVRTAAT